MKVKLFLFVAVAAAIVTAYHFDLLSHFSDASGGKSKDAVLSADASCQREPLFRAVTEWVTQSEDACSADIENKQLPLLTTELHRFSKAYTDLAKKWHNIYQNTRADEFMSYKALRDKDTLVHQSKLLTDYIKTSIQYRDFVDNSYKTLDSKLEPYAQIPHAKDILQRYSSILMEHKGPFDSFVKCNIDLGIQYKKIIKWLDKNHDKWTYMKNDIYFMGEDISKEFNSLVLQGEILKGSLDGEAEFYFGE